MKTYDYILALDPSGAFHEGKGTTGWCLFKNNKIKYTGILSAKSHCCMESYWESHINLIDACNKDNKGNLIIVIEDYILYPTPGRNQPYSKMETSRLIGAMQLHCWNHQIPYEMQRALILNRWNNEVLLHKGILAKAGKSFTLPNDDILLSRHTLDAIRHGMHYATFKNGGKSK